MTIVDWLTLASVCFVGAVSPGPSLLVIMRTALEQGRAHGLLMALTHGLGVGVYAGLVVFGLAGILLQSPAVFDALRFAGAGFLVFLAWQAFFAPVADLSMPNSVDWSSVKSESFFASAWVGAITALLNPKIAIWFLALLSQFLEPQSSLAEKLGVVVLAIVIDSSWYAVVVFGLTRPAVRGWFVRHLHFINRLFAALLVLVAARVVL